MVEILNANRQENWIDLHNLRAIKYGCVLHVDCHLTVTWYLNVQEAHREIDALAVLIKKQFGESLELFVHSDGCLHFPAGYVIRPDVQRERIILNNRYAGHLKIFHRIKNMN